MIRIPTRTGKVKPVVVALLVIFLGLLLADGILVRIHDIMNPSPKAEVNVVKLDRVVSSVENETAVEAIHSLGTPRIHHDVASFVYNRASRGEEVVVKPTAARIPTRLASAKSSDNHEWIPQLPAPKPQATLTQLNPTLAYTTPIQSNSKCREQLDQATHELRVKAWLSAETSAWSALSFAVGSIQTAKETHQIVFTGNDPSTELHLAHTALFEARDFYGIATSADPIRLETIVRSHRTKVLEGIDLNSITATKASEAYLDDARNRFMKLANYSVQAAEAMDLLAAIYLSRNEPSTMPSHTSLCLRRAALGGQPGNPTLASNLGSQLAEVGLFVEAEQVLKHSLSIQYDRQCEMALAQVLKLIGETERASQIQARLDAESNQNANLSTRIPEVIQLSPNEFAAISQSVIPASPHSTRQVSAQMVSNPSSGISSSGLSSPQYDTIQTSAIAEPSMMQRAMNSVRSIW